MLGITSLKDCISPTGIILCINSFLPMVVFTSQYGLTHLLYSLQQVAYHC